ncbi:MULTISPECIES: phosphatase PAP2 family protein [Salipiger]|jgi:hypothetical protein|uniref:Inositolphosphotransferase Aur1/Ipt1 domain-containing protein n=1 Tax=Salipiger profundus TaxID=1229727 RepID=A0A1U7D8D1_9RHOB|nr:MULTISPECIES: phosphatase PAP2 family protein [Salipiger]APX24362.1 hypothetical protein Ga0080559_TMP3566 [Salipiger profundus]GGA19404.1 hypothetical protein GCM10011326_35080 [Salipiger profundus]SFD36465.1 PAP2 superfamily protein [Salipiger profundus]
MIAFPSLAFLIFGVAYALVSLVFAIIFRDGVLGEILSSVSGGLDISLRYFWAMALVITAWAVRSGIKRGAPLRVAVGNVAAIYAATFALHFGFTLFKTTMPEIVPHYADPYLAAVDAWLHGQSDPWSVIDRLIGSARMIQLTPLYQGPWLVAAFLFPVILVASDDNPERVKRYLVLYCCSWIVIGNIIALGGMSVGPVFYDRFYGSARFEGLTRTLDEAGLAHTTMGMLQDYLWSMFAAGREGFGTGISAFASVHVSVATVIALYCGERSPLLAVPSGLFCGMVLLLSVWSGYHYAVDGYVSIATVALIWAGLRRWSRSSATGKAPARYALDERLDASRD